MQINKHNKQTNQTGNGTTRPVDNSDRKIDNPAHGPLGPWTTRSVDNSDHG
jgi:hypothetical protein